MKLILIYTIISFILDGLISNYIPFQLIDISYLKTIYTIISLVIIFNYFSNYKKYIYILIIIGLLFDITYTNTFLLNTFIFIIIYFILCKLDYILPNNIFTINIKSLICIYSYHIISYIILVMINYNSYDLFLLENIMIRSSFITIVYTSISYLLFKKYFFKIYEKKINI